VVRRAVAALTLLAPLFAVPAQAAAVPPPAASRVIVQFTGTPAIGAGAQAHARAAALHTDHADFARHAGVKITHDFTQTLNAVAVTTDAAGVARLGAMSGVAAVYPDRPMHARRRPGRLTDQRPTGVADPGPAGQ
jgi:hypothetical protein